MRIDKYHRILLSSASITLLTLFISLFHTTSTFATDFRNMGPEGGCIFDFAIGSLPANPETLYCASITGGIYMYPLDDYGTGTWTALHEEIPFQAVELFRDLSGNRVLLGGTIRKGLWRSNNSTLNNNNFRINDQTGLDRLISFKSISGYRLSDGGCDTVYAILGFFEQTNMGPFGNGVYVSYTSGQQWEPTRDLADPAMPDNWNKIYADAATRGTAYALCSSLQGYSGIWKTTDAGQNWTRLSATYTGSNYRDLPDFFDANTNLECLYQSPNRPDTLYFCSRRQNRSRNWQYGGFWDFTSGQENDRTGRSVIGMIDLHTPQNVTWIELNGFPPDLPFQGEIFVHDTDVAGADTVWVSIHNGGVWTGIGTIPSSLSWTQRTTGLYAWYPRQSGFIYDQGCLDGSDANIDTMFLGTWIAGVWASKDAGMNWEEMNDGMTNADIRTISIDFSASPYKFYSGTWSHGIQKSTDWGNTWSYWGEDATLWRKARFNRQFPVVILNPFSAAEDLLVGVESHAYLNAQQGSQHIPGGLWTATSNSFAFASSDIPDYVAVTCIDTVVQGTDAIYAGTGDMPTTLNKLIPSNMMNPLFRAIGSPDLGDPPYDFQRVTPEIPYNMGILSVLIDRDDASRTTAFLGLGSRWLMADGAIIYGPVGGQWQTIVDPNDGNPGDPGAYDFLNKAFHSIKKHPSSNDTIFACGRGYDGETWGALASFQWGCLLQIYRDSNDHWHIWDISPPVGLFAYRDNAVLSFDVREKDLGGGSTRLEIAAAVFNNHNIPPGSGNFQDELHICVGVRNISGLANDPWNWFSDVIPDLTANLDFSPVVWDVQFAAQTDTLYLATGHSLIRYDISGLAWP